MSMFRECEYMSAEDSDEHYAVQPDEVLPIDILVKAHRPHIPYLTVTILSTLLMFPNHNEFIVLLDSPTHAEKFAIFSLLPTIRILPEKILMPDEMVTAIGGGYSTQLLSNMYADLYTTAEYVAIMDADAVFGTKVTKEKMFKDDKVVLRYRPCPVEKPAAAGCVYKERVEMVLQLPYIGEFMEQVPIIVPRHVFAKLRAHVEAVHKKPFIRVLIEAMANTMDWTTFSQHAALGNFMWHMMRDEGHFVNVEEDAYPHIGRHTVHEHGGSSMEADPFVEYQRVAAYDMSQGLCHSFSNVNKELCGDGTWHELLRFQGTELINYQPFIEQYQYMFSKKRCFCNAYELI